MRKAAGRSKPRTRTRRTSLTRREIAAYHEAGHAVASEWLGASLQRLKLAPDARSGARPTCHFATGRPDPESESGRRGEQLIQRSIQVSLAGKAVEDLLPGRAAELRPNPAARSDLESVGLLLEYRGGSLEVRRAYVRWLYQEVRALLAGPEHWRSVEALAEELLATGTVRKKRVRKVILAARMEE